MKLYKVKEYKMNYTETRDFLKHIDKHTEQEIMASMLDINIYLRDTNYWTLIKHCVEKMFKIVDRNKVLYELFKNEQKFSWRGELLDFP